MPRSRSGRVLMSATIAICVKAVELKRVTPGANHARPRLKPASVHPSHTHSPSSSPSSTTATSSQASWGHQRRRAQSMDTPASESTTPSPQLSASDHHDATRKRASPDEDLIDIDGSSPNIDSFLKRAHYGKVSLLAMHITLPSSRDANQCRRRSRWE